MKLTVKRKIFDDKSTIGEFYIDGVLQCNTLEDKTRAPGEEKIYGETAIPYGLYQVKFRQAGQLWKSFCERNLGIRQERGMLHLFNIEGQTYDDWYSSPGVKEDAEVLIHIGNTPADTLGCLLVGMTETMDELELSTVAYCKIYPQIADALERGEDVTIEYIHEAA